MKLSFKIVILRTVFVTLTVLMLCFIFFQSALTGDASSAESGKVLNFLNGLFQSIGLNIVLTHSFVRTSAHFLEFAAFASLLYMTLISFAQKPLKSVFIAFPSTVLLALCDETVQLFTNGRAFQLTDILTDSVGGFTAILLISTISFLYNNFKPKGSDNHEQHKSIR